MNLCFPATAKNRTSHTATKGKNFIAQRLERINKSNIIGYGFPLALRSGRFKLTPNPDLFGDIL